ncbi:MAG: HNH endonuclease [Prevotellaceae bacterium]|nr:HNH endonuclease [Prevotellaceae bacterium]
MAKDERYRRMIAGSRWRRLRRQKLTACPLCERCAEEGRITAATEVHHVRPVEEALTAEAMAQRMYDPTNLRSLCRACHVRTHVEMGRSGRAATRRINGAKAEEFERKFFHDPGGDF